MHCYEKNKNISTLPNRKHEQDKENQNSKDATGGLEMNFKSYKELIFGICAFLAFCGLMAFFYSLEMNSPPPDHITNQIQPTYYIKDPCYNSSAGAVPLIQVSEAAYYGYSICRCGNGT